MRTSLCMVNQCPFINVSPILATPAEVRARIVATGGNLPLSTALHFKPSELDGVGKVVLWGKLCCDRQNAAAGCTDCADCNDAEAKAVAVQGDPTAEQGCAICLSQFAAWALAQKRTTF